MGEVRDQTVRLRVSAGERRSIEARAEAAGFGMSEFVRRAALGVGQAPVGEARQEAAGTADPGPVPAPPPPAPAERPGLPLKNEEGLFWCPAALCMQRSRSQDVCPKHGERMVKVRTV